MSTCLSFSFLNLYIQTFLKQDDHTLEQNHTTHHHQRQILYRHAMHHVKAQRNHAHHQRHPRHVTRRATTTHMHYLRHIVQGRQTTRYPTIHTGVLHDECTYSTNAQHFFHHRIPHRMRTHHCSKRPAQTILRSTAHTHRNRAHHRHHTANIQHQ